tara:strand:- start:1671 stop:2324 length:654 start_codon:yes stop_codon:yes gene_type:complete
MTAQMPAHPSTFASQRFIVRDQLSPLTGEREQLHGLEVEICEWGGMVGEYCVRFTQSVEHIVRMLSKRDSFWTREKVYDYLAGEEGFTRENGQEWMTGAFCEFDLDQLERFRSDEELAEYSEKLISAIRERIEKVRFDASEGSLYVFERTGKDRTLYLTPLFEEVNLDYCVEEYGKHDAIFLIEEGEVEVQWTFDIDQDVQIYRAKLEQMIRLHLRG